MKIAIGSDHAGYDYRQMLIEHLRAQGHEVVDCGCPDKSSCDYPVYGRKTALAGIDLSVGRGKIVGLLGPNGSGKTTLIKLLCGLLQPTSGSLAIAGQSVGPETKAIISYLPDRMYFASWMRAVDLFDLFRDFYQDFDHEKAVAMCHSLGVEPRDRLKTMSKGTKEKPKTASTGTYIWPLPGYTPGTRTYGYRMHPILGYMRFHSGQDIGAPSGTSIIAADSGTVSVATYDSSYGNYVTVYHSNGTYTLYAHMSSLAVSAGQTVSQGQVIGYVGTTGSSTGNHLHFEVRVNGNRVDPVNYFKDKTLYVSSGGKKVVLEH